MEKTNVVPIHKKGDKETIEDYRPVSLLPIFREVFECLLYDTNFLRIITFKSIWV